MALEYKVTDINHFGSCLGQQTEALTTENGDSETLCTIRSFPCLLRMYLIK